MATYSATSGVTIRASMAHIRQYECNRIAAELNARPRKGLNYRTPEECYAP